MPVTYLLQEHRPRRFLHAHASALCIAIMTPGLGAWNDTRDHDVQDLFGARRPRDITIQVILSIALGTGAFLAFCILRPRWEGLYAARKKQNDEATALPELPRSLFGWIPALWRITDQQVLASAGLDAYVVSPPVPPALLAC